MQKNNYNYVYQHTYQSMDSDEHIFTHNDYILYNELFLMVDKDDTPHNILLRLTNPMALYSGSFCLISCCDLFLVASVKFHPIHNYLHFGVRCLDRCKPKISSLRQLPYSRSV